MQPIVSPKEENVGCKFAVGTITHQENFKCQAKDLYAVLTKQEMVSAFARGPCKVDAVKGGK